jgi:septum formation protein
MIYLTSQSRPRHALLEQLGFRFWDDYRFRDTPVNAVYHGDRDRLTLTDVEKKTIVAARDKVRTAVQHLFALQFGRLNPSTTVVVGADTVAYFDGRVLDRPLLQSPAEASQSEIDAAIARARTMLSELRGQEFSIVTGLVVARGDDLNVERSCHVTTRARMRSFSDAELERYISSREPLDKAGGFGIQGKGVMLFDRIDGSYSNVVGLPLLELWEMLHDPKFKSCLPPQLWRRDQRRDPALDSGSCELRTLAMGDVNFDVVFDRLPAGIFAQLSPPGRHLQGDIRRQAGGTGVNFSRHAREVGFAQSSVLGVIGGDPLGRVLEQQLKHEGVEPILASNPQLQTSIALVLRDEGATDTSLTITDASQALSVDDVKLPHVQETIASADVVFVSGYCLVDATRREAAIEVMNAAHVPRELPSHVARSNRASSPKTTSASNSNRNPARVVVLDVTVEMDKAIDFVSFIDLVKSRVDVLVAELPTVLSWLDLRHVDQQDWSAIREQVIPRLQEHFNVLLLRTSTYSHEIIASPAGVFGPRPLDYHALRPQDRLGYADKLTAQHLFRLLSPRLLLASASPRRRDLLRVIVDVNKIEVLSREHDEKYQEGELVEARVQRLALEKARGVVDVGGFSPTIQIVIGADTEVVLDQPVTREEIIYQPQTPKEAMQQLRRLEGRWHRVVTGLALIDVQTGHTVTASVTTEVELRPLKQDEIAAYARSGEPLGKAGGYAIQGKGAAFVKQIRGSYSNVVGLPLERLSELLHTEFGISVWDLDAVSNWRF